MKLLEELTGKTKEELLALKELDLSNLGLEKIPEEVFDLEQLERLDLSFNKINELPRTL